MSKILSRILILSCIMAVSLSVLGSHSPTTKIEKNKIEFSKSAGGKTQVCFSINTGDETEFYFYQFNYIETFAITAPKLKHIEPAMVHLRHYALGEYNCGVSALSSNRKYKNTQRYWCQFVQSNTATS